MSIVLDPESSCAAAPPNPTASANPNPSVRPTPSALERRLATLPAASIGDLVARAALLTRRDRKYVLPDTAVASLLDALAGDIAVLTIGDAVQFRYETVYLDTPDLRSYHDAAHGRPRRWKVRVRSYLDSSDAWMEVKVRDRRGQTVKHRLPRSFDAPLRLDPAEQLFTAAASPGLDPGVLTPVLRTTYRRITLLDRSTDTRATIDSTVCGVAVAGGSIAFRDRAIVETKTAGRPSSVDRALWALGHRPQRFSKYCTSFAALRDDLPANRWHRSLTAAAGSRAT